MNLNKAIAVLAVADREIEIANLAFPFAVLGKHILELLTDQFPIALASHVKAKPRPSLSVICANLRIHQRVPATAEE